METTNKIIKEILEKCTVEIGSDMAEIKYEAEGVQLMAFYYYDNTSKDVSMYIDDDEDLIVVFTETQKNMIFDHIKHQVSKEF